jgi:hypothetical protein
MPLSPNHRRPQRRAHQRLHRLAAEEADGQDVGVHVVPDRRRRLASPPRIRQHEMLDREDRITGLGRTTPHGLLPGE